jgi:hypothetical protein
MSQKLLLQFVRCRGPSFASAHLLVLTVCAQVAGGVERMKPGIGSGLVAEVTRSRHSSSGAIWDDAAPGSIAVYGIVASGQIPPVAVFTNAAWSSRARSGSTS